MTVLLARSLDPLSFGYFAIFRTAITFLGLISSFGLGTVSLRLLSEVNKESSRGLTKIKTIMKQIAAISGIASCFLVAFIALSATWASPWLFARPATLTLVIAVTVASLGIGWLQVITDAGRGLHYPELSALFGGIRGTPFASICLFFMLYAAPTFAGADWVRVSLVFGISLMLSSLMAIAMLYKFIARSWIEDANAHAIEPTSWGLSTREMLSLSVPLAASGALMFLTTQGDFFLTGWFSSDTDCYAYIAARRWALLVAMPLAALNLTAGGLIARAVSPAQKELLESFLRAGTTVIGMPALIFSLAAIVSPVLMLRLLFGPGYEAAASVLPILVIGQVFVVVTGPCGLVLSLTGHERISLQLAIGGFAALAILGPWVASNYGATGVAWLVTISATVISMVTWVQCWRLTGLNTFLEPSLTLKPREFAVRLHLSRKSDSERPA